MSSNMFKSDYLERIFVIYYYTCEKEERWLIWGWAVMPGKNRKLRNLVPGKF